MMPRELPHLYIIDPKAKVEVKPRDGQSKPLTLENNNFYPAKHQAFIFNIGSPGEELTAFIDKFLDEKLDQHYVSDDRVQSTKVKWVNGDTFEKDIVKNPQVTQCVIEIIKDHCPACFIAKFNTNMISRKLHDKGLLDQIPFFRMKISNQVPWLGDIPHSPIHLYVRKEGSDIVEIKLMDSPLPQAKTDNFLRTLEEKTGITGLKESAKIDVMAQRTKYFNMLDLDENYDINFDQAADYVSMADRQKEKEKEK